MGTPYLLPFTKYTLGAQHYVALQTQSHFNPYRNLISISQKNKQDGALLEALKLISVRVRTQAQKGFQALCAVVPEFLRGQAPEEGEARGRDDVLPEGLVSFGFLLTGSLEFPLSLFVDTRDTSVFVPREKEHQIFKVKAMICSGLSSHPTLCLQEWNHPREGVTPSADHAWAFIVLHSLLSLGRFPLAFVL